MQSASYPRSQALPSSCAILPSSNIIQGRGKPRLQSANCQRKRVQEAHYKIYSPKQDSCALISVRTKKSCQSRTNLTRRKLETTHVMQDG